MSHEIRTPLNAVVGFSSVLAETSEDEESKEFIHYIEQNNNLLLQLIDDILDISKIEAGAMDFSFSTFELEELMTEIRNMMRYKSENTGLPLNLETPQKKLFIYTDRKRLTQILINLLTNAFKFTCKGEITFGYRYSHSGVIYFYVNR